MHDSFDSKDYEVFRLEIDGRCEGYVTVDFAARGFRYGICTLGPLDNTESFSGRGWKEQIVKAAQLALEDLVAESTVISRG